MAAAFALITEPYVCVWDSSGCRNLNGSIISTQNNIVLKYLFWTMLAVTLWKKQITWGEQTWAAIVNRLQGDSVQFWILCKMSGSEWLCTDAVKEVARADCWKIMSNSSAGNYSIIEAFQSLTPEWRVFEGMQLWVLNSTSFFLVCLNYSRN